MAAVLACGPKAVLSHGSAAALWGIRPVRSKVVDVSVPIHVMRRRKGILVHRRKVLTADEVMQLDDIPLTAPICTLVDIAAELERGQLEAAVNEADRRGLTDPEALRAALDEMQPRPGTKLLRETLDRRTFALTDPELERRFLRLVREIGLPTPETGGRVNGFKVDFFWPDLGLVVETDGLRYHRTPAQQARDRVRDQTHTAAGVTTLRFTRAQVRFEAARVGAILARVARRLDS
jgi:very-short-patch-repair endonuclease